MNGCFRVSMQSVGKCWSILRHVNSVDIHSGLLAYLSAPSYFTFLSYYSSFKLSVVQSKPNQSIWPITGEDEKARTRSKYTSLAENACEQVSSVKKVARNFFSQSQAVATLN